MRVIDLKLLIQNKMEYVVTMAMGGMTYGGMVGTFVFIELVTNLTLFIPKGKNFITNHLMN